MVDEMVTDLKKNINKEEIDRLPLFVFTGEVIVIEDPEHAAQAARFLRENSFVGFDTETRPAFHKGERYKVGLLQLADPGSGVFVPVE